MSGSADFSQRLNETLGDTSESTPCLESFQMLRGVAEQLQRWLTSNESHPGLKVDVVPGFQSQLGQQLNVVLQIPSQCIRDTLFRAYVPPTGVPVNLDFYGEEPVASGSIEDIENRTLEFLGQPEVKDHLRMYRQLLDDAGEKQPISR